MGPQPHKRPVVRPLASHSEVAPGAPGAHVRAAAITIMCLNVDPLEATYLQRQG